MPLQKKITNGGEKTFDEGGKMALKGKVDEELLEEIILKDTYLDINFRKHWEGILY